MQRLRDQLGACPTRMSIDDAKHLDPLHPLCIRVRACRNSSGVQLAPFQVIARRPILDRIITLDVVRIEPDHRGRFRFSSRVRTRRRTRRAGREVAALSVLREKLFRGLRGKTFVFMFDDPSACFNPGGTGCRDRASTKIRVFEYGYEFEYM